MTPPKRTTLTLQRPLSSPVERNAKTDFRPPRPKLGPLNGQETPRPKPFVNYKQEWREHQESGPATPILLDARDISWMIEGGDRLMGKTIIGHRNGKEEAVILNHPFSEVFGWWDARVKRRVLGLTLVGSGRRMVVTKDGLSYVRERNGVTFALPRGKGTAQVPVDMSFALLMAWFNTGPEKKPRPQVWAY